MMNRQRGGKIEFFLKKLQIQNQKPGVECREKLIWTRCPAAPAILKDSLDLSEAGYHHDGATFPCHSLLENQSITPVHLHIDLARAIGQYVAL